ncbi:MAG: carbon storage regulator [Oscillospiraceae bacterium]|nr:carbon storage regulator [Oscillospiraceae bacterium]
MLVITRKTDESLLIADSIEVTVLEISKDRVKLGVSAPKDITIIRYELITTQNANRESAVLSKNALNALLNTAKKQ